ncbi:MAG: TIGR04222 domain-containing membrane protein [Candidatus Sphingomonas phytovorans]|nr:TIGR04222 domain-containing membrane protein [Sphingomonas sp.]WEJ99781.1 MAG: TIGR04222 domain-containing membrane protein [Sphingomonas sp.]
MSLGPFDLTGRPFLELYGLFLVLTIIAGFVIPRWLRPEGRSGRVAETGQLAYLAGGAARFADAVVMRLLAVRALVMIDKKGFHAAVRNEGRTPAERSVLALPGELRWPLIERALKPYSSPVRSKLVAAGLMMDDGLTLQMRFWQTLPYFLLLLFGGTKLLIGIERGRPVGYLTLLLILTAIFALIRWIAVDRRTQGGHAALKRARMDADRLRRAPTTTETDLAVALFGTSVLVGSGWSDFHTLRTASSGDSGSGSGDGGGGGGCGGGGCGGCGG